MKMRKTCALAAALAIAFCMASCGKKDSSAGTKEKESKAETSAAEKEASSEEEKKEETSEAEESKAEESTAEESKEDASSAEESAAAESKEDASSAADSGTSVTVEETTITTDDGGSDSTADAGTSSTDVSDHNQVAADTAAASINVMVESYLLEQDLMGTPVTDLVIDKDHNPELYEKFSQYATGADFSITIEGGKVKKIWVKMAGDDGKSYESTIEN